MAWFYFFVVGLAVFRLTRLIVYDKITHFIRKPFMQELEELNEDGEKEIYYVPMDKGIRGWIGELLNCYWCTGIWMTIFILLLYWLIPFFANVFIFGLAIAGFAAIIETIVQRLQSYD